MIIFNSKNMDFTLSPYTGLTRQSWIEAGEYLLRGIFKNIKQFSDPVVMPRNETKVTYPHSDDAVWEKKAEYFEGLARSFFIAAPLIHDNPELEIEGYKIRDYYKSHVLRICTSEDPLFVGSYDELKKLSGDENPFRAFQQTVETCALVICLWLCKSEIWDIYSVEEKQVIADFLMDYANGNTVPQNWRLFNMLDLAFLHMEGYEIDKSVMREHASHILNYYAGQGWYRDGHSFDYYSCWAFNVYAPLWNVWYGYENEPYIAARFEENSNELMKTYADFFDKDGFTNMWGRSCIYRNASTSPFDANLMLKNSAISAGLARRICSGSLLQFINRDDFLHNGIPTLGFYGQFTPLVQGYSCAESPFWLGKAFLCLHLPPEHPFWAEKENNGTWETLEKNEVKVTTLDGPALCFSNHEANGTTILRTGKVVKNKDDRHGMWNYSKLCFNTKYPWEAAPIVEGREISNIEAQQYVLHDITSDSCERANVTFWHGEKDGVLYRRQFFNYNLETECHWLQAINLADFVMPYGIVRVDRIRLYKKPVELTLGAYGFPNNDTSVIRKTHTTNGIEAQAIILKGHDLTEDEKSRFFVGREKQLAMTIYNGWQSLNIVESTGTNPACEKSIVVYASANRENHNHYEQNIFISQVITKESYDTFTDDELFPITNIIYTDKERCGGYGPVTIELRDGSKRVVDFDALEGKLML